MYIVHETKINNVHAHYIEWRFNRLELLALDFLFPRFLPQPILAIFHIANVSIR